MSNLEELYYKRFKKEKEVILNNEIYIVKELSFSEEINYYKYSSQDSEGQISFYTFKNFICSNMDRARFLSLTPDEMQKIITSFIEVNKPDEVKNKIVKDTINLSVEECIDFLSERYSKTPFEIMDIFSKRQLQDWSNIASSREHKIYGESEGEDIQSVVNNRDTEGRQKRNPLLKEKRIPPAPPKK